MPGKNMLSQAYKTLYECLAFLEHPVLRTVLIIVLVVFNSGLIPVVNIEVARVLRLGVVKLIVVLFITLFAMRDPVLAILLAMALVMSTCKQADMEGMANFMDGETNSVTLSRGVETNMNSSGMENGVGAVSHMRMGRPMTQQGSMQQGSAPSAMQPNLLIENMENQGETMEMADGRSMSQAEMEALQANRPERSEEEISHMKRESFDNRDMNESIQGFNVNPDCTSGNGNLQCSAVQTFNPSLNTQGLNMPQGLSSTNVGSPW
jgi:hypothetical protein